jgi:hypothetical protein
VVPGTDALTHRRFLYDGDALIAEYDGNGAQVFRHVPGPGTDETALTYGGTAVADKRYYLVRTCVNRMAGDGGHTIAAEIGGRPPQGRNRRLHNCLCGLQIEAHPCPLADRQTQAIPRARSDRDPCPRGSDA